jgi:hypothetical protein
MPPADDPALMSPLEILSEVASILARGYLRHRHEQRLLAARGAPGNDVANGEESAEFTEKPLDKPVEPSAHSQGG